MIQLSFSGVWVRVFVDIRRISLLFYLLSAAHSFQLLYLFLLLKKCWKLHNVHHSKKTGDEGGPAESHRKYCWTLVLSYFKGTLTNASVSIKLFILWDYGGIPAHNNYIHLYLSRHDTYYPLSSFLLQIFKYF